MARSRPRSGRRTWTGARQPADRGLGEAAGAGSSERPAVPAGRRVRRHRRRRPPAVDPERPPGRSERPGDHGRPGGAGASGPAPETCRRPRRTRHDDGRPRRRRPRPRVPPHPHRTAGGHRTGRHHDPADVLDPLAPLPTIELAKMIGRCTPVADLPHWSLMTTLAQLSSSNSSGSTRWPTNCGCSGSGPRCAPSSPRRRQRLRSWEQRQRRDQGQDRRARVRDRSRREARCRDRHPPRASRIVS